MTRRTVNSRRIGPFYQFALLPAEIRIMIWRYAHRYCRPRLLFSFPYQGWQLNTQYDYGWRYNWTLLMVNTEARAIVLELGAMIGWIRNPRHPKGYSHEAAITRSEGMEKGYYMPYAKRGSYFCYCRKRHGRFLEYDD